jgi:hypothetical protein
MQSKQLELFKYFTLAEERDDAHTSASAMLRDFMEQMDLDNIKLMLSDEESLADVDTETYFAKLQKAFLFMRMTGNTVLESAEGRCNRCHPGVASFTFKGDNIPWHISFLFHVKDNKVVNIHECHAMWTMFPELDGGLQLYLDEPDCLLEDADEGMDDPPF